MKSPYATLCVSNRPIYLPHILHPIRDIVVYRSNFCRRQGRASV